MDAGYGLSERLPHEGPITQGPVAVSTRYQTEATHKDTKERSVFI